MPNNANKLSTKDNFLPESDKELAKDEGSYVILTVLDSGRGIPEAIQELIF